MLRKHLRLRADAEHDPYAFSVTVSARGVIFFTVTIKPACAPSIADFARALFRTFSPELDLQVMCTQLLVSAKLKSAFSWST